MLASAKVFGVSAGVESRNRGILAAFQPRSLISLQDRHVHMRTSLRLFLGGFLLVPWISHAQVRPGSEFQLAKMNGKLVFPKNSEQKILKQIKKRLLAPKTANPLNMVIGLMNALNKEGFDVQAGGGTFKSNLVEFPLEKRLAMWKEITK